MEEHSTRRRRVGGADEVRRREFAVIVCDEGKVACFSFALLSSPWRGALGNKIDEGDLAGARGGGRGC